MMRSGLFLAIISLYSVALSRTLESCSSQGQPIACRVALADPDGRPDVESLLGFALTDYVPPNSFICALNATQIESVRAIPAVQSVNVIPRASIAGHLARDDLLAKISVMLGQNPFRNQTQTVERLSRALNMTNSSVKAIGSGRIIIEVDQRWVANATAILADQCEVVYVEITPTAKIID